MTLLLAGLFCIGAGSAAEAPFQRFDMVVYGATPAGIGAALAAAGHGAEVALVERTGRIGGMVTSGLSHSDFRTFESLSGAFLEFTRRVELHYRDTYGPDSAQLNASFRGAHGEPSVNLRIFRQMLAEHPNVTVFTQHALTELRTGEFVSGRRPIRSVTFEDQRGGQALILSARVFIDATYEGDLMAMAGESYHIGRESRKQYGETLAGNEHGEADGQVQGYNFRLIMTQVETNRVMPHAPPRYQREDFTGVLPLIEHGKVTRVFGSGNDGIFRAHEPLLPNGKADVNDTPRAPVRMSMPDINDAYPDGDEATRRRIVDEHHHYTLGLLYFLQNDPAVPPHIRDPARQWGFCQDEFAEYDHVPPQLYIREARRLIGQHVFTENDTVLAANDVRTVLVSNAIAIGDYIHNCHGTGRVGTRFDGRNTGEFYKVIRPFQIPYGVIVPKTTDNLLVPVALSASHAGFNALRLEPTWMALGQAAGLAAHLAIRDNRAVQSISVTALQELLHAADAATSYVTDAPPDSPFFQAVQWFGVRGAFHGMYDSSHEPLPPPRQIIGQYSEAFPRHDANLAAPIDEAMARRWHELARQHGVETPMPSVDGALTRGEFLQQLHRGAPR